MKKNNWIILSYFISIIFLGIIHFYKDPDFTWIHLAIHIPAIVGIISLFFSIFIPFLNRELLKNSINSARKLHHFFSYIAWSCILLHMVFLFVLIRKFTIFIPSFSSWNTLLIKSGPIAVLLILFAGIGLLFMKHWKTFLTIHSVNIIAIFWITIHGVFKDKAIPGNIPYLIFLIILNLIIIFIIIYNYLKQNERKQKKWWDGMEDMVGFSWYLVED